MPAVRLPAVRLPASQTPAGRLPDVLKPGIHGARTHWIRGFRAFQLARRTRIVMLMGSV